MLITHLIFTRSSLSLCKRCFLRQKHSVDIYQKDLQAKVKQNYTKQMKIEAMGEAATL